MKSVIIIIFALTTIEVAAQNQLLGIKGGVNWTNISSDFFNGTDFRPGVPGGITYEYLLKQGFSVESGVIYDGRGFLDRSEIPTGGIAVTEFSYTYLSVPVKTGFYVGSKIVGFAKVGLIPSLLIDAKTKLPLFDTSDKITGTTTVDITNRVAKFDLAGLVEMGSGYQLTNRLRATASVVYQHSLTSITNTEYFATGKIRHNGIALHIGLQWTVKKK